MQLENQSAAAALVSVRYSLTLRLCPPLFSISLTGDGKSQNTAFSAPACRQSSTVCSYLWLVGLPSGTLNPLIVLSEFKINRTRVHHVKELWKCVFIVRVCV